VIAVVVLLLSFQYYTTFTVNCTMAEAPSWLTPEAGTSGAGSTSLSQGMTLDNNNSNAAASSGAAPSAGFSSTPDDDKELPGVILTMRLANMGVAVAVMTISVSLVGR
jgi:hypothetical protein